MRERERERERETEREREAGVPEFKLVLGSKGNSILDFVRTPYQLTL